MVLETKKYYLAGPMTGHERDNISTFLDAKSKIEESGFSVLLPYDIEGGSTSGSWGDYLAEDIRIILTRCSGIIVLPGWEKSRGTKIEIAAGLQQSLKQPFEFRFYKDGKVSDPIHPDRIALGWYWNWSEYYKNTEEQSAVQAL